MSTNSKTINKICNSLITSSRKEKAGDQVNDLIELFRIIVINLDRIADAMDRKS